MFYKTPVTTFTKTLLLILLGSVFLPASQARIDPSDQLLKGISNSSKEFTAIGEGHTLEFDSAFRQSPWLKEFNNNVINGDNVPAGLREKGQAMLDQVEDLDKRCAAASEGQKESCAQQRDAALAQLEKMVADNNPDLKILISQAASQAGDFSSEFDPAALVSQFDGVFAQLGNLKDMLGDVGGLTQNITKQSLQTPLPAGPSNSIKQTVDIEDLKGKRLAEIQNFSISEEQGAGFFDKIKNFWQQLKPGVQQAFVVQVWAASPFGTLGQSGQSQLRTIGLSRGTESFDKQSKQVNDNRDRLITQHNDISGQGKSALQERVQKNLEVMNDTTKEQDKSLQSLQHICQSQKSSVPCWENGNEIPFDLLALLMGAVGGGGSETATTALELAPYAAWMHCPLPDAAFKRKSEGTRLSALLLDEKARSLLTVKSALPQSLHTDGCIVALQNEDGLQYFSATLQPEITERDTRVEADLALLKISTVHTEDGEDLAAPETAFDDFINEYWPQHQASCINDPVFRIGDELQLYGFDELEEEAEEPSKVAALNGLANFVADEDGSTKFTTNAEETFNGGLVARKENGCFKGVAKVEINKEEESNTQSLISINKMRSWLETQNVELPLLSNEEGGR